MLKKMRSKLFTVLVGSAAAAIVVPLLATPAQASCVAPVNVATCQLSFYVVNASKSRNVNADGVYAVMNTEYLNVPMNTFRVDVERKSGEVVIGHNTRGIVLEDQAYTLQFWQVGYTMGFGDSGLSYPDKNRIQGSTGENSQNKQFKKVFVDGQDCHNSVDNGCDYYLDYYGNIDGGTTHTYQIQRNNLANGPAYRFWLDRRQLGVPRTLNIAGYSRVGAHSERSPGHDTHGADKPLNMQQYSFADFLWHVRGGPITDPPGTTAYQPIENGAIEDVSNIKGTGCNLRPIPGSNPRGPYSGMDAVGTEC